MPSTFCASRILCDGMNPWPDVSRFGSPAAGARPILDEPGSGTGPPPAAAARAEALFETIGIGLILLIVLSALWILIRGRL
jgi:hypothetical protein